MKDLLYKEFIFDHYKNPRNFGQLKNFSYRHQLYNSFCGDKIKIDVLIKKRVIVDIKFQGKGCIISLASASLLTEFVKNKKVNKVLKMKDKDYLKNLGITLTPSRLKCALLSWEVLKEILIKTIKF